MLPNNNEEKDRFVKDNQYAADILTKDSLHPTEPAANPEHRVPPADFPSLDGSKVNISHAPLQPHTKKPKPPVTVIALTIVVFVALMGAAGYAYWSANKVSDTPPAPASTAESDSTKSDDDEFNPAAVDQTTKEVDDTINGLDDASDFSQDSLSDDSLGL